MHMETYSLSQMRRGVIGPAVLGLLRAEKMYGLDILRSLGQQAGLITSEGTIYPLLNRLEAAGLLTSEWNLNEGARPRRYYEITVSGRDELLAFTEEWVRFTGAVDHSLGITEDEGGCDRGIKQRPSGCRFL